MKRTIFAIACLLALGLTATNVNAEILAYGIGPYIGHILDGIPSNPANEIVYISNLITLAPGALAISIGTETYDRIGSTAAGPFPSLDGAGATQVDVPEADIEAMRQGINVTGFSYILAKYNGGNAGSYVWDVRGLTTVDLPAMLPGPDKYGLSHYTLVPEGGATLVLLGGALVAFGVLRRRLSA